jgi:hypothetical protein
MGDITHAGNGKCEIGRKDYLFEKSGCTFA